MEITPGAYVEGRPLYHISMNLSIGKMYKKISPQNRKEIFRQIAQISLRCKVSTVCRILPQEFPHQKIGHSCGKCRDTS